MNYRRLLPLLACTMLMGCSSGGGGVKEMLGLTHQGPDEYRVVSRPPLSVPPEFNLRPPGAPSPYLSGKAADEKAHEDVLGIADISPSSGAPAATAAGTAETAVVPVTSGSLPNNSDAQFLADAGGNKIDPQIRQKILDERTNGVEAHDPRYLFGGKTQGDSVVDATKEADRIKTDKDQNKPVTAGDTPVVAPKEGGFLSNIF